MKKNNSFPIFLNIVLGILLIGSISLGYFFGNFDGISIKDLKTQYISKSDIKFTDLAENIQSKYINKAKLEKKTILNPSVEKAFDEDGNPLEMLTNDTNDLKDIIKSLQDRILYLERENIIISNDKEELAQIVKYEKSKKESEKKNLLSKNLEKINEAEQQHYKNISELTSKINYLQRENIRLSQQITKNKQLVEDKVKNVIAQKEKEKEKAILQKDEDVKSKINKIANIKKEKNAMNRQLKILLEQIRAQREDEAFKITQKDKQIARLQDKINTLMRENNSILTNNSKNFIKLQNENTQKSQEINKLRKTAKLEKQKIRDKYIQVINDTEKKYQVMLMADKNRIKEITQKLVDTQNTNADILEKAKLQFADTQRELTKELNNKKEGYKNKIANLLSKNKVLGNKIIEYRNEEINLNNKILKQKLFIEGTKDKVLQLQDKINYQ